MRTFILVCVVALVVAGAMAYALGVVNVATDRQEGKIIATVTINTNMFESASSAQNNAENRLDSDTADHLLNVRGKITAVRPDQNEFVLAENIKNWTFELAKNGKVLINDRESKLADMRAGDDATVTFDRQSRQMLATEVRCTRR
jgi:hypothetical protein